MSIYPISANLDFYGNDYEKIVELFTSRVKDKYKTYLDYFRIPY